MSFYKDKIEQPLFHRLLFALELGKSILDKKYPFKTMKETIKAVYDLFHRCLPFRGMIYPYLFPI